MSHYIDEESELIMQYRKLLDKMKIEIFVGSLVMGLASGIGLVFKGVLDLIFKLDLLLFFGGLVFLFLSYLLSESIMEQVDGRVNELYKYWTIGGLFTTFLSGVNITLMLIVYTAALMYTDNLKLFMKRANWAHRKFLADSDHLISADLAYNNYRYLKDRVEWNTNLVSTTTTIVLMGYSVSYLFMESVILDIFQILSLAILVIYAVPKMLGIPGKEEESVIEESNRIHRITR